MQFIANTLVVTMADAHGLEAHVTSWPCRFGPPAKMQLIANTLVVTMADAHGLEARVTSWL